MCLLSQQTYIAGYLKKIPTPLFGAFLQSEAFSPIKDVSFWNKKKGKEIAKIAKQIAKIQLFLGKWHFSGRLNISEIEFWKLWWPPKFSFWKGFRT